ncbi:hypothetical protein BU17DRAFT_72138 [Hysterangium stoloniferum]|nr:hypothetical protein BU17DRAFT_72138 [Hysterangium stoloniferum]
MIITTGIPDGPVVCRQELRTLLKDANLTNLFILALERMMKVPQTDPTSWYQIGAIHGRPYIPYDGIGTKGSFGGYCCHSSTLFPPWHRPYLAHLEQFLGKHCKDIANEFKDEGDKEKYCIAAEKFRLPYWDWATEAPLPDILATQDKVTVHRPDGSRPVIDNPLWGYKFNPIYDDFGDGLPDEKIWEAWTTTVRYPTTTDKAAKSEPQLMQNTLKNNRLTLRDRAYNLLTQAKDYNTFSHDAAGGLDAGPGGLENIEAIHNQIHVLAGRNGHMGVVDYAAFDPIFWLHHVNVDRLFAIWQALNPDLYVTPLKNAAGTFTRKPGEIESSYYAESPLTPFRRTPEKFWDSNGVRDTRVFRYTYPELEHLEGLSKEEKINRVRIEVNKLYGRTAPVSAAKPSVFKKLDDHKTAAHLDAGVHVTAGDWHKDAKNDKTHYHEWFAHIEAEKYAINTSFFVHIFITHTKILNPQGEFTNDPKKWGLDPNLVGSHCVFANNATFTGCEKCRDAHDKRKIVRGNIPLTSVLGNRLGGIDKLEPEKVTPYLEKNLHWAIQRHDTTVVDNKDVPGLKVTVGHVLVECPGGPGAFAKWGQVKVHKNVTSGRAGGH